MAETVFCHALFSKLREESIDLDELGMMLSGARGSHCSPVTNDVKLQASQELAGKVDAQSLSSRNSGSEGCCS